MSKRGLPLFAMTPEHTVISRLDARVKLVLLLAATVALFSASSPLELMPWVVLLVALMRAARMDPLSVLRSVKPVAIVLLFTVVANAVALDGRAAIVLAGPVGIDPAGALRGCTAALRIVLMVGFALTVSVSTTPPAIADACVRLMRPLARFGVPVGDIGLAASLALRFIPIVAEEFDRIRLAQRARGVSFDEGTLRQRIGVWASVLTPLVVSLMRRADRLGESMAARCYGKAATIHDPVPLSAADRSVLVGGLVACAFLGIMCWIW